MIVVGGEITKHLIMIIPGELEEGRYFEVLKEIAALPLSNKGEVKFWGRGEGWREFFLADMTYFEVFQRLVGSKVVGRDVKSKTHLVELLAQVEPNFDLSSLIKYAEGFSDIHLAVNPE